MPKASEICIKDPTEVRLFSYDFSGELNSGASLSAISSVTATPSGLTIGASAISGTAASVFISSGTANTDYTLLFTVTTDDGETIEGSGLLQVRDSLS